MKNLIEKMGSDKRLNYRDSVDWEMLTEYKKLKNAQNI